MNDQNTPDGAKGGQGKPSTTAVKRGRGRPKIFPQGPPKRNQPKVRVYYSREDFILLCDRAIKAGFRTTNMKPFVQEKGGFERDVICNTTGLSEYLKNCEGFFCKFESERITKMVDIVQKEKELAEEKKKLGVRIG